MSSNSNAQVDLVGGPFAVIESDPGVFTSLTRRLGIKGIELVELYSIEPWAVSHLSPHGLIFCFTYAKDTHRPTDFDDPAADKVWFANQLSDDACATHAILNVILNCPDVDVGDELRAFRADTKAMDPVMRGLAITNSPSIRPAHNFFARPSDLRASLSNLTIATFDAEKKKAAKAKAAQVAAAASAKPPPAKRAKTAPAAKGKKDDDDDDEEEEEEETYHFIGYVPAYGKVWELDGLKSGPLEVGELPSTSNPTNPNHGWMDIARPALRMKMAKYGGGSNGSNNIKFSLLAIVDDAYVQAHDELEWLRREKGSLERALSSQVETWQALVDPTLLVTSKNVFDTPVPTRQPFAFAHDFAARRMARDMEILQLPSSTALIAAWTTTIQNALRAKMQLEDEITKGTRANTDHIKRTHHYDPFVRAYIRSLHNEGLLNALLDRDDDGVKIPKKRGRKPGPRGGGKTE